MTNLMFGIGGVWLLAILAGLPLFAAMGLAALAFVGLAGLAAGAAGLALPPAGRATSQPAVARDPDAVLARLLEGTKRFVSGQLIHPGRKPEDFAALAEGQAPVAIIVGCADSRVGVAVSSAKAH